ncbi:hypothetical protein CY35_12G080300 [Sphagnum magellanicum]|nr:hypothetical protein CY35_12G080300 [Sphagnum magellanicum]
MLGSEDALMWHAKFLEVSSAAAGLRERAAKFVTKALEARWMADAMVCRSWHPGVWGGSLL